jgi:hypothetical protein
MLTDEQRTEILAQLGDARFGYNRVADAVYVRHVDWLLAEREELVDQCARLTEAGAGLSRRVGELEAALASKEANRGLLARLAQVGEVPQ